MDISQSLRTHWRVALMGLLLAVGLLPIVAPPARAEGAPATAYSTQATVSVNGTVLDDKGEPIIGAAVLVVGTTTGTVTDLDGRFSLDVAEGTKLQITYLGYVTQEVTITADNATPTITLPEDSTVLEETVVVGYGIQKRASTTGSVAVVTSKSLENQGSMASPVQALQGQVPGVIITRSSSAPGEEGWGMKLRGAVSKNNSEPLVIIDGVEYESVNELRLINPADIESINFLKDASASIYGSKAAGGVVLVTTKKAKDTGVKVDYSGSYTYKYIGLSAKLMSLDQWCDAVIQARTNDGYDNTDTWIRYARMAQKYKNQYIDLSTNPDVLKMGDVADYVFFDTDWQDILWGPASSTQHELSIAGGKEGNTFRLSLGYMYDASNLKWGNNHNQRFNIRLNNNMTLAKGVTLNSVISYNRQDQVAPTQIGKALNANTQQPGFPASTTDGKPYGWGSSKWTTPNWICELGGDNNLKVSAVNISETLRYEIIPGLAINAVLGYNTSHALRDTKSQSVDFYNYAGDKKIFTSPSANDNYYESSASNTNFFSVQGFINWNHTFAEKHEVTLMGGAQYNFKQYALSKTKAQNIQPSLEVLNGSGDVTVTGASKWQEAILSYFGRANYSYDNRYLVEFQLRYDGSSKFQAANRWAFFWGASLGWRLSQEKFMSATESWLSDLKLRASYGTVGNQSGIDRYSGVQLYNFSQGAGALINGEKVSYLNTNGKLVSLDRTWERIHNYNVALDFSLLKSRLTGTFEAFWKRTNNMLIDVHYPALLGDNAPTANEGKFKAWGYEGNVTWNGTARKVQYHVGGTITYADNELVDNGGSSGIAAGVRSDQEGYPLNSVWGLRYCGKIQTEEQLRKYVDRYAETYSLAGNLSRVRLGDNMYEDVNGDGKLTADDLVYLGTDDPKLQFSVNLGVEWKGIDVSVMLQGAGRRTIWRVDGNGNPDIWRIPMRAVYMNGADSWMGDVWSPETPGNRYPTLTNESDINNYNYQCSSWSVENGAYLRLKNLTVGYTMPEKLMSRTKVPTHVRFYVTGTDICEASHIHDGWDPEGARMMSNASRYPFLRTWTFGANITF